MTRFRTQDAVGIGTHGTITVGVAERLGAHPVALRDIAVPAGPRRQRLRFDAERVALVGHPGLGLVEELHDLDDDRVRIATTLGAGGSVADRIAAHGPLPGATALAVALAAADALAAAHRAGLSHRRLRDTEILVDAHGTVLVCDVALADALARPGAADGATVDTEDLAAIAARWVDPADRSPAAERLRSACTAIARDPSLGLDAFAPFLAPSPAPARPAPTAPIAAAPVRPRRSHRPIAAVVGGAALVLGLAVGFFSGGGPTATVLAQPTDAVAGRDVGVAPTTRAGEAASIPCPRPHPPTATRSVGVADVDGDGCVEAIGWDAAAGTVAWTTPATGPAEFRVGGVGDLVALGDWDCDGTRTVGLYRPTTGATFLFPTWATPGGRVDATPGPALPIDATVAVVTADGCDTFVAR